MFSCFPIESAKEKEKVWKSIKNKINSKCCLGKHVNKAMNSVRVSVEWLFRDIVEYFKFVDFKKNFKIGLTSIQKMCIVCALLRIALTCFYGNTTSEVFELDTPTLEEYFA